jgi:hypothetical protein
VEACVKLLLEKDSKFEPLAWGLIMAKFVDAQIDYLLPKQNLL